MNLSKCAGFCVRLNRFSRRKLCTSGANLKILSRKRSLATHGNESLEQVPDITLEKGKLNETEALNLLNKFEHSRSLAENVRSLDVIWSKEFSSDFCNTYLRVCIENGVKIDRKSFLEIARAKADVETFHWILKSACYDGDVATIVEILGAMKEVGISADESVFNMIVLGHVVNSGIEGGRSVLKTMKAVKIPISENTHWSMLKGLSKRTNRNEFINALRDLPPLAFNEEHFYDVLYTLGLHDNYLWIEEFLNFVGKESVPRQSLNMLEDFCFRLIRRGKPYAAYIFYEHLQEEKIDGGFGVELLEEMLHCKTPIEMIIHICKGMIGSSHNSRALFDLAELTLRNELIDETYTTFSQLETIRPHYFWPLFNYQGKHFGEKGVLEVLNKMCQFGVQPDYDTVSYYLLKYCDISNLDGFLGRLERFAVLTMKDVFTPVIYYLLSVDRVDEAQQFCAKHNLPIIGERVLKQLSLVWKRSRKSDRIVFILQRICETNSSATDWTGNFLFKSLKPCKSTDDFKEVIRLINLLKEKELKISSLIADHIYQALNSKFNNCDYREEIEAAVDKLLDISKPDSVHIEHPREMNLEELECHYIELKSKNMDTRGVLRHMIQGYSRVNNHVRVEQLRDIFKADGCAESAGMKASILNAYIQGKNLPAAKDVFKDLKGAFPGFSLDSFKIVNYAELLVESGEIADALDLLKNEKTEIRKTEPIKRNCWRLLNAAQNPGDARKLYEVLVEKKYCKPTNIILGPLVRIHLKNDDLQGAVSTYVNCVKENRCTPLQLELLNAVIQSKNDKMVGIILDATAQVHGSAATKLTFLAALAENGMEKPLRKFLMELSKIDGNMLRKRCERWVNENKILPLKTLLNSAHRLDLVDLSMIRLSILQIYGAQNDCESALQFWEQCNESNENEESKISPQLTQELLKLLDRCKYQVPDALKAYCK